MTTRQTQQSQQPSTNERESPYEEQLANAIAQHHAAIVKRFGIPSWILRDPGPRVSVEDDDVAFQEGAPL